MDFELVEELKNVLKGIETFMTSTLKRVYLKKDVMSQRNYIVASITDLLQKLDRISGHSVGRSNNRKRDSTELPDEGEDINEVDPIPARQLKHPTKVGLLEKKRQQGFGLQKSIRYCVIKDRVMYYYKNRRDKKQTGAVVLDGYDVRPTTHVDEEKKKIEYAFELIHSTKRYYKFVAEDEPALTAWVKALRASISSYIDESANSSDSEQEDAVAKTDEDRYEERYDNVFQDDILDTTADSRKPRNNKDDFEELEDQKNMYDLHTSPEGLNNTLETTTTNIQLSKFPIKIQVQEESIPPPPTYPPPQLPENRPILEKRPSQSECFQAFASDLKLRLIKVDVPSVPRKILHSPEKDTDLKVTTTNGRKPPNACKLVPTKPPRPWNNLQEPNPDGKPMPPIKRRTTRKKAPVPLPSLGNQVKIQGDELL